MMNINKINDAIRYDNYYINNYDIFKPFVIAYNKLGMKFKFKLFHQYVFMLECDKSEYKDSISSSYKKIRNKYYYMFKPETFIGYRYLNDVGFVPFFVNLTNENYDGKDIYKLNGYSTYDDRVFYKKYKDNGLVKNFQIIIDKHDSYKYVDSNDVFKSMSETLKEIGNVTLKKIQEN